MIRGKRKYLLLLALISILCAVFAVGCKTVKKYYTVTFIDDGSVYCRLQVERGKRLELPSEPARDDENAVFDGWYFDEEAERIWDVKTDRVTQDTLLWSNFLYVSERPSNISMGDEAFSSTVVWLQRGIDSNTEFTVKLHQGILLTQTEYGYSTDGETFSEMSGENGGVVLSSYKNHADINEVRFTPESVPKGGVYSVEITCEKGSVTQKELYFKGEGTQDNPFLLTDKNDLDAINTVDIPSGNYYKVEKSFHTRLLSKNIIGNTFDGNIDGNGKTITIDAGGCGLFGTLGEQALIEDLTVDGGIDDAIESCAGIIASINHGTINYCIVSAEIESKIGSAGSLVGDENSILGGAGGFVGVNYGVISNGVYSGSARAKVGAGGFAVINNGEITNCTYSGTLGAGNAIESGSSTNSMSYMGGIAAINYGKIELCTSTGRILAQRSLTGNGSNNNMGGIVALNAKQGTVVKCFTNSMRIYGNNNVGGIVGENSGAVAYCYVTANYRSNIGSHNYIGGSANVGGIAGLTNADGTVKNCYVAANVYAYNGAAYKVAQSCESCAYLAGNLDERNFTVVTGNGQETTAASALIFPEGDNIAVSLNDEIREEYKAKTYSLTLDENQFALLNGENGFYKSKTNLTFDRESNIKDRIIEVVLVLDGDNTISYSVSKVSGDKFTPVAPDTDERYVAGYALAEGTNKIVFADGETIGYDDLEIFNRSEIKLYPVYVAGTRPESKVLNVAVYGRFIDGDMVGRLLAAFKNSEYFDGYDDAVYTVLTEYSVDDYAPAVKAGSAQYGRYNISFGHNNLDVGQRENISVSVIRADNGSAATRQVGIIGKDGVASSFAEFLLTDEAKKIMNPDYVEVTLYNGGVIVKTEVVVSNASLKLSAPEAEEGYVFAGWSLNEAATENETLFNTSVSYAELVKEANDKTLNLYARFKEDEKVDPDTVLRVAVFNNSAFDSAIATKLVEAFKTYCQEKGFTCNEAESILLVNETKYADFTAAAIEGGYNIAIGFQANDFTDKHGIPKENIKDIRLSASSTRRIALLNSDKLAVEFFSNFIESDTAKKILNPAYVPEGEGESKVVLKVAVYKKFIDQPVVDALKAAFAKYYNVSPDTLQFDLITTGNGSAFTSDAASYDVALGHKGGTSFTSLESLTVAMLMNADNKGEVAKDRKAERLTDNEVAIKFMEFLQTDEGKAALTAAE